MGTFFLLPIGCFRYPSLPHNHILKLHSLRCMGDDKSTRCQFLFTTGIRGLLLQCCAVACMFTPKPSKDYLRVFACSVNHETSSVLPFVCFKPCVFHRRGMKGCRASQFLKMFMHVKTPLLGKMERKLRQVANAFAGATRPK